MINWTASKVEYRLIAKIVVRAVELARKHDFGLDSSELQMDLTACHLNGCPLDLEKLLAAPDSDFGHDVLGIRRYIDRKTGELTECFLPQCAEPVNAS